MTQLFLGMCSGAILGFIATWLIYRKKLDEVNGAYEQVNAEIAGFRDTNKELMSAKGKAEAEAKSLSKNLERTSKENKELQTNLKKSNSECKDLKSNFTKLEMEQRDLRAQVGDYNSAAAGQEKAEAELMSLKDEIEKLQKFDKIRTREMESFKRMNDTLKKKIDFLNISAYSAKKKAKTEEKEASA